MTSIEDFLQKMGLSRFLRGSYFLQKLETFWSNINCRWSKGRRGFSLKLFSPQITWQHCAQKHHERWETIREQISHMNNLRWISVLKSLLGHQSTIVALISPNYASKNDSAIMFSCIMPSKTTSRSRYREWDGFPNSTRCCSKGFCKFVHHTWNHIVYQPNIFAV